jgi:hypothetical protein
VPWCEPCSRFYNPNTLEPDGSCPACGNRLAVDSRSARGTSASVPATPPTDAARAAGLSADDDEELKAPWHFWVMVAAVALYLGWRLVQLVAWALERA